MKIPYFLPPPGEISTHHFDEIRRNSQVNLGLPGGEYMPDNTRRLRSHFCWNFPNYLESIYGKLLAFADAKYCFPEVYVGSYGRSSDGGTLANPTFGQTLKALSNSLKIACFQEMSTWDHSSMFLWQRKPFPFAGTS